ncbi:NDMA-dependent alcohol dehydrogenase [Nocardioides sp. Leaf285]|uniref:NDMA-dependent alcohol dehydrogenase n=1 Tax=Nocardioides sp. Leaf285 TaxID=1736322 RepID=UPI000703538D|nr:NDMA-dependent alcohol dehydrogenase [Nocardioides sp. Leaf285]KQP65276.1 alcohol dehydrogenase [Nocardioides sp. Leaf285]
MKTKAAVLWGADQDWQVEEVELGEPVANEVQVQLAASGLCHSDEHVRVGDIPMVEPGAFPFIGGHEGAGVVTKVGPGVTSVKEGDHVVLGFIPSCGQCAACARGHQNLCDLGATLLTGQAIADSTNRIQVKGQNASPMCLLGTFSPYVTVHEASAIKILPDIPLDKAALVGCGVTTGWGSSVYAADVRAGETVVVVGVGGIGANAVQGARAAGARHIVAIDPVPFKREMAMKLGATHAYASIEEATAPVTDLTWGAMAQKAIICVGRIRGEDIAGTLSLVGKGGTAVVTGMGSMLDTDVSLSLFELTLLQKRLQGAIFGSGNPRFDIPNLLRLYMEGELMLDELITTRYRLEDINQGYADMNAGTNIRGLIEYGPADW